MNYEIQDFSKDVIERSNTIPVLVDFWAPWCGPCKVLGPVLEKLAQRDKDSWVLAKVNTDDHQDIAEKYGVRGIPNAKLFVDGKMVDEFTGALPEAMVTQWLKKALPSKHRKVIQTAEQLILENNAKEAQGLLEDVLKKDSNNHQARVLLAGTYLYSNPKRAVELVKDVEEHTEHFTMAQAVRTIAGLLLRLNHPETFPDEPAKQTYLDAARELSRINYDAALEKFVEVIRTNRYYDEDGARKACLAIFRTLGDNHEVTQRHRRPFSSALYV
jgi:putative thioredoxin